MYLGLYDLNIAIKKAKDLNLDLIKLACNKEPYVYRLGDYNKYLFSLKKGLSNTKSNILKELRFKLVIADSDLFVKLGKVVQFLKRKFTVKLTVNGFYVKSLLDKIIFNLDCFISKYNLFITKTISYIGNNIVIIIKNS